MPDGLVIKGLLTDLTPAEKLYLLRHPSHISIIRGNADKAKAEAFRLFAIEELYNARGDAFRHCYWSALLARDIGARNAREFTDAHEAYSANPPRERAMDLHNNGVGIRIGTHRSGTNDATISRLCMMALENGELVTSLPTTGQPY